MDWLKKNVPLFYSPTFWGLTLTALFALASLHSWLPSADLDIIWKWTLGVTGVNIIWKSANKLNGD
jgi:hypothetical protein